MKNERESHTSRRANELGPAGHRAGRSIEDLREARRLTQKELAARMTELGRPVTMQMVSKMEQSGRRVDVDDLLAVAIALGVNPDAILFPRDASWDESVTLTPGTERSAWDVWRWAQGLSPLPDAGATAPPTFAQSADFATHALPQAGEYRLHPVSREAYDLGDRFATARKSDPADLDTWERLRDYVIRGYRQLGIALEEWAAQGDREMAQRFGVEPDTEAARQQIREAAASVRRPALDYAPGTAEMLRESVRLEIAGDE